MYNIYVWTASKLYMNYAIYIYCSSPLRESWSCPNIDISKGSMLGPDPVSDLWAAESAPAELLMDRPELARDSSELRQSEGKEEKERD